MPRFNGGTVLGSKVAPPDPHGLTRTRLFTLLDRVWLGRVGTVIAPAGSGKSTLLAQWASQCGAPVAWYDAEASDSSGKGLLRHLERALSHVLAIETGWQSVDDALLAVEGIEGGRALLIIDDLHVLKSSEAEQWLSRFIQYMPRSIRVVVASRETPGFDLSRLQLDGGLVTLGPDELRFRHWEVERLFRRYYSDPVDARDLAEIHRRTDGWVAGLQLFHLALVGKPASERRRILDGLATHNRLLKDYLARNVLEGLEPDLRSFLVMTSPFGVMTADLCDRLLDRSDSATVLAQLAERQIFTTTQDEGRSFAYHQIFRSHLEGLLVEQLGESAAMAHIRRAALLLLDATAVDGVIPNGICGAALRSLCRAEAWTEAFDLLRTRGQDLAGEPGDWLDNVPERLTSEDPWLQLALARRHLASGSLDLSLAAYKRCESELPPIGAASCQHEMVAVAAWATKLPTPASGLTDLLRRAVARHPLDVTAVALDSEDPIYHLVAGVVCLLAGDAARAAAIFDASLLQVDNPVVELAGELVSTITALLTTTNRSVARMRFVDLASRAELLDQPWLARQACACLGLTGDPDAAQMAAVGSRVDGDLWGEMLASLFEGVGRMADGGSISPLFALPRTVKAIGLGHTRILDYRVSRLGACRGQ